jgi:hypothetical protein
MSACKNLPEQTKAEFQKLKELMSKPLKLARKVATALILHPRKIIKDLNAARKDYAAKEFYNFGFDLGDLVNIILLNGKRTTELALEDASTKQKAK